jgi:hypothetical protein
MYYRFASDYLEMLDRDGKISTSLMAAEHLVVITD